MGVYICFFFPAMENRKKEVTLPSALCGLSRVNSLSECRVGMTRQAMCRGDFRMIITEMLVSNA